jgi:arylsulfatase A
VKWIEQQKSGEPFFLYFPHRNPHGPHIPAPRFNGTSGIGAYGDFMNEFDWSVGEVLAALDRKGLAENTIVILSSDNGGATNFMRGVAEVKGHRLNGPLLGQKAQVYEGGVRVPLLARWPGVVKAGATSDAMVALTDMLATTAELVGARLPEDAGEDSFSFLHVLRGTRPSQTVRSNVVVDSYKGLFAIREGSWKLIVGRGDGGPIEAAFDSVPERDPPMQLYDLSRDPGETTNLYAEYPKVVSRLSGVLREIQYGGRSR